MPDIRHFRAIFLSDFHIGAKSFNDTALLDFLKNTESDYLYLVGDIIDGWKLNKRWHWNENISRVFDELFRKSSQGTRIIYITGNHDEAVRDFNLIRRLRIARRLGIQMRNKIIHRTIDGRRFLVLHGDQFDRALLRGSLSRISDRIYSMLEEFLTRQKPVNIEIEGKIKRFSLAKFLSYHSQIALNILNNFEWAACREAIKREADGVICGHTHIPALKKIKSITYANCGSWIKNNRTAVVEDMRGNIDLIDWPQERTAEHETLLPFSKPDISPVFLMPDSLRFRRRTRRLMMAAQKIWPSPHVMTTTTEPTPACFTLTRPYPA